MSKYFFKFCLSGKISPNLVTLVVTDKLYSISPHCVVIFLANVSGALVYLVYLCSRGRGFESWRCIQDGHDIFTLICCKNSIVCLKRPKINEKEAGVGPFFKKKKYSRAGGSQTESLKEL